MKTIIGLLTIFTLFSFSEKQEAPKLSFLEGLWKSEAQGNYETWQVVNDNELKGSSYQMKNGKKITSEYLSIKTEGGKTTYTAIVIGQNNGLPVDFVLNTAVKGKLSFENLNHDFPKKIQYTKLDDRTFFVEVLGDNDQGFSYRMVKQ